MVTRMVAAVVMLAASAGVFAQQVNKCTEQGQTVYQTAPCSHGAASKTWNYTPQAEPERPIAAQVVAAPVAATPVAQSPAPRSASSSGNLHLISQHRDGAACERAKAQRAAAFKAAGHRRTYEATRRLDDAVFAACK